ncbi:MAG TPA: GNAT family N-acetyltransferase [Bacteroidetes bacterium]|jgi:lipid II:glycine glycyltransferase (peptidoglycan interpeptide bridge formation enzyme)|nr:GNAT family N-acetyltransferase [Bacteroidota bacterium]
MLEYKGYKLVETDCDIEKQIMDLIQNNNGSIFHEPKLNKIVSRKFNTDLYYLVDNQESIKYASVVHATKNGLGLKRYHFKPLGDIPYAGFIGDNIYDFKNFKVGFYEGISYVGFPYGIDCKANVRFGETSMVDLLLDEDYIFNNILHSKRRNMIRKAILNKIVIEKFYSIEGLEKLWPILEVLHKKLGYDDLDFDYYEAILSAYFNEHKAFVLIAKKDGEILSGIIVLGNMNYMHYYKGASKEGVINEGQGELLQWEAIREAKNLGSRFYDLCNLNKTRLPGIYKFKTGISDQIYKYPIYSYSSVMYKVINRLTQIK